MEKTATLEEVPRNLGVERDLGTVATASKPGCSEGLRRLPTVWGVSCKTVCSVEQIGSKVKGRFPTSPLRQTRRIQVAETLKKKQLRSVRSIHM